MENTLDFIPGEGDIVVVTKKRMRRECFVCGEPAHYKHTFLLQSPRTNPYSQAYEHDDCSWCEDASTFVCKEHAEDRTPPEEGLGWCSTFPAIEDFAHMFLFWVEEDAKG